uniref:Uncharacterized protein n=1 Tax=Anopheles funestus TaxID=62324 RepID=A0A182S0D2_ANOFN
TFLKTALKVGLEIVNVAGGQLWYQGVEKSLQYYYGQKIPSVNNFDININMDGLPLHKSGKNELWPILMQVHNGKTIPIMVIGIYCGLSKPENVEGYLRPFVDEM